MTQPKFIFAGPPGVGKSTAIATISDVPPLMTDVDTTDDLAAVKAKTTVAMDYGELKLEDGTTIRLYGTPGQKRFEFMWRILLEGALGLIILVDNSRPDPMSDLYQYLEDFASFTKDGNGALVIGVTRSVESPQPGIDDYTDLLMRRDLICPIFEVDMREKQDVLLLMDALLATLELAA